MPATIPKAFHFTCQRRVEWADTDCAGIVHFTSFLRYVESAEHEFWRSLGRSVHMGEGDDKQGWPRLSLHCDFAKPVRFEQVLTIALRIMKVGSTTLNYGFWIMDGGNPDTELVASVEFTIIHVGFDPASGKIQKMPIPEDLKETLNKLQASV